jgi:hypothetical protein
MKNMKVVYRSKNIAVTAKNHLIPDPQHPSTQYQKGKASLCLPLTLKNKITVFEELFKWLCMVCSNSI